ncbi:Ureohydrolase [Aspergillus sclerotioniger CBS 115572]|uniref:Arginase n=1 Tax=Aspergillus sclerotioniger CBS 115572 TaxID=1450535 RepID=A0A317W8L3_9EURO|nr:Ureohydrolase [Aspergillus sclerotioniger CBS 115572]PWY81637.1 Ureohydrolase [Aspergillus sclerotioniger CBS 115572]
MAQRLSTLPKFLTNPRSLRIIGAKSSAGGPRPGPEAAPDSLVRFGLLNNLRDLHYDVDYNECLPKDTSAHAVPQTYPLGLNNAHAISSFTHSLSEQVYNHARQGSMVLTLGGDRSIAIGSITGAAKATRERLNGLEMAVIYVDAHADINTPETSGSGNVHGMPVTFATGVAKRCSTGLFDWIQREHLVNVDRLVYIGLRDVDDEEWRIIRERGIKAFDMRAARENGIQKIMDMTLDYIGDDTPIHVSFDIDSLDPTVAPSTVFPVDGKLSLEEGMEIARRVRETGSLVAMDLVEVNPSVERERLDLTMRSGVSVVESALGNFAQ